MCADLGFPSITLKLCDLISCSRSSNLDFSILDDDRLVGDSLEGVVSNNSCASVYAHIRKVKTTCARLCGDCINVELHSLCRVLITLQEELCVGLDDRTIDSEETTTLWCHLNT